MAADNDGHDVRVTMAVLGKKLDTLTSAVTDNRIVTAVLEQKIDALTAAFIDVRDETRQWRGTVETRARVVEEASIRNDEEHKSLRSEQDSAVKEMRRESRIFSSIAGTIAAMAGAVTSWLAPNM